MPARPRSPSFVYLPACRSKRRRKWPASPGPPHFAIGPTPAPGSRPTCRTATDSLFTTKDTKNTKKDRLADQSNLLMSRYLTCCCIFLSCFSCFSWFVDRVFRGLFFRETNPVHFSHYLIEGQNHEYRSPAGPGHFPDGG